MAENARAAPHEPAVGDAPFPGARRALVLLLAINLFNYIDRYVLAAVLPAVEREYLRPDDPNSKTLLGLLATAFMLSYMFLAPLFGWLADRWPRWWLVGFGVILWSFASGASGWAPTFAILLATRCFVGVGEAAYGPVAPTVISDLYPKRVRGQVLSWFYAAIPVGSAIGFVWGGFMGDSLWWRWAFYLVVPPGLLLGLLSFLMPEPQRGQSDLPQSLAGHRSRWADYRVLLKIKSYVFDTLGMTAMTFAIGGISTWMPYYIQVYRGAGDARTVNGIFGPIVVVSGLTATLLGGFVGDRLRDRFSGSYFLVSGAAMLVAFPFFLAVLVTPFPWAWVMVFAACFCLFFNTGPTNTILANVTHPAIRATGFAVNILIIHALGDAVSPLMIGIIADATASDGRKNFNAAFGAVSAMILIGGILWLWGARYLAHDTAVASTLLSTGTDVDQPTMAPHEDF